VIHRKCALVGLGVLWAPVAAAGIRNILGREWIAQTYVCVPACVLLLGAFFTLLLVDNSFPPAGLVRNSLAQAGAAAALFGSCLWLFGLVPRGFVAWNIFLAGC